MRKAIRVAEDGTVTELDLDAPEGALKVLQTAVGGYIEPVSLEYDFEFYCDEEGLYNKTEHNGTAEMVLRITYGEVRPIMGPVVFTGGIDAEGNSRGLSEDREREARGLAQTFRLLGNGIVWVGI